MQGHTLGCSSGFTKINLKGSGHAVYTYVVSLSGLSGPLVFNKNLCDRLSNILASPFNEVFIFVLHRDLCGQLAHHFGFGQISFKLDS